MGKVYYREQPPSALSFIYRRRRRRKKHNTSYSKTNTFPRFVRDLLKTKFNFLGFLSEFNYDIKRAHFVQKFFARKNVFNIISSLSHSISLSLSLSTSVVDDVIAAPSPKRINFQSHNIITAKHIL